jgi:hypothetical protein
MNNYRIKILLYLMIAIFQLSCYRSNDFEKKITGTEKTIWSIKSIKDNKYEFFGHHIKVWKNGKFKFYYSDNDKTLGKEIASIDICEKDEIIERKWSFDEEDSTFSLGIPEETFKVITYSNDTILMEGKGFDGKFIWVKINPPLENNVDE